MDPSQSIDSSPPKPAPREGDRPPALPWRTRLSAAFALLVTLLVVGWTLSRLFGGTTDPEPSGAGTAAPETGSALLILDAVPWGRIHQIIGPQGLPLPPPSDPVTPLVLELEPGPYRVDLKGPPGSEIQFCEVELSEGARESCHITFAELEPVDYFREAGWWH